MSSLADEVNNMIKYFKENDIPYAIGGGYAIKLLCDKYSVLCPFDINNIDIFYMSNTPIAPKKIGNATRKEDSLRTTITYITSEGIIINLTMKRSHYMNIIQYKGMNIMHPINLITYYNDDFERDEIKEYKLFILNSILEIIKFEPKLILNKTNLITTEKITVVDPQSRATNAFYQRLQTICE
jgi:hypothetical protein